LRGSVFDIFGYAGLREEERRLVPWYRELVTSAIDQLTPESREVALELARLPEAIRGYEEIKLRNVAAAKERAEELMKRLGDPAPHAPARP
jgi:indolepyruvate ferredoxin oxidoreductase